MTIGLTVTHRRYVTYADAHYGGNLVNGAYVLDLFGDVGTEASIRMDSSVPASPNMPSTYAPSTRFPP
ncbi:MAG TPA: hypothetical protein VK584_05235 [Streptosporangiaceae bacterium]|nr:hypothetical protein [Streptosporangiaceae bacterium]